MISGPSGLILEWWRTSLDFLLPGNLLAKLTFHQQLNLLLSKNDLATYTHGSQWYIGVSKFQIYIMKNSKSSHF